MRDVQNLLVLFASLLATLVVPTVVAFALGRRAPRSAWWRAWWCFWIGQLALPVAVATFIAVELTREWFGARAWLPAIACGLGMAVAGAFMTVVLVRAFSLGVLALARDSRARLRLAATRLGIRASLVFVASATAWEVASTIRLPGRWDIIVFIVLVVWPIGLASLFALALAIVMRR
jgi:hypothetical protein